MSYSPYPAATYRALIEWLQEKRWEHAGCHLERRVTFSHHGKHGVYQYTGAITHDGSFLQFFSNFSLVVTNEKLRPSVAELIARANFSIHVGRFEIDMDDGQVGFRITHVIGESLVSPEVLECYLRSLVETVDRYFPSFMQHIHAGCTPEDAVFLSEIDYYANRLPDEIVPSVKAPSQVEEIRSPAPPQKREGKFRKPRSRKNPNSQGELPL